MTARWLPWAALAVVAGALIAAPWVLPSFVLSLLVLAFIAGLFATSVNILAGEGGLVSLGHAGIAAVAGYGVAWGTVNDQPLVVQLALAAALVLVVSSVYGLTTMRTDGIVFLMITLALGMIVYGLAFRLSSLTGGQNGLTGIRRPDLVGGHVPFYFLALGSLVAVVAFVWVVRRSPFGLTLRGVRDSESRMTSLGYSVTAARFVGMLLSGAVAGLAGVLSVWHAEFISPSASSFARSAMAVVMVILGGTGTLLGPVVGAGVVVATEHWVSSYVERWPTLLGAIFIATVIFLPKGLVGTARAVAARTPLGGSGGGPQVVTAVTGSGDGGAAAGTSPLARRFSMWQRRSGRGPASGS